MTLALDILVGLAFAAWASFALSYHLLAAWAATEHGRNIMGVSVAVTSFLALVLVARLWPDYDRSWLQVLVYCWLALLGVQRLHQLVVLQRRTRRTKRARASK